MKIYRYFLKYATGNTFGVIYGGYDENRIIRKYNLKSWREVMPLQDEKLGWLVDPEISGEYWFTELGNTIFKEKTFDYIVDRLPRQTAKAIYRDIINLEELPGWENLVQYQDQHQLVF